MRTCLIAVDLQVAFLDDRRLEPPAGRILAGAASWLGRFRELGLPIIHIRTTVDPEGGAALPHWDDARRREFSPGSAGWRFAPLAEPREQEPIVDKVHYSGFESERLTDLLAEAEAEEVVVVGVHLHGCVRSTALDAGAAGLGVSIGLDATGSNDPPHAAASRRWLGERGFRLVELRDWEGRGGTAESADARDEAVGSRSAGAFNSWSRLEPARRVRLLEPLGELLREESERLADAMAVGIHKPLSEGRAEVDYAADLADRAVASVPPAEIRTPDGLARRAPHGSVLLITPWNNPIGIPVGKIVPALVYGNTAIWAPSPHSAPVTEALCELFARLGLPRGVLEPAQGGSSQVARLIRGGHVRAVSISGSLRAGRALQDLCAAGLLPLQAELGGNNAAIVCDDVDIDEVADALVAGAFGFAGQRCTATRRAIVLSGVYRPVAAAVKERVERLRAGDPRSADTTFAPVISAAAAAGLEDLIARAAAGGATVWRPAWADAPVVGGGDGLPFVAPAVIEGPVPDSEVVREESFGPVLVLTQVDTLAEAIKCCNDVPQGLVAAIWAGAPEAIDEFTRAARAGVLKVNRPTAGAAASLPFGGFGLSGSGPPEHGEGDAEFHTRWQAIYS